MIHDWPPQFERTPPDERRNSSPYMVSFGRATSDLKKEMERMGVDDWKVSHGSGGSFVKGNHNLPKTSANPDDPGFVLRWSKGGTSYAVACDRFTSLRDNIRTVSLWVNETRMREQRPVVTGGENFAAAALPEGDEDRAMVVGRQPAHDVLGVAPDAPDEVVRGAFRELSKKHHSDTGDDPDPDKLQRVREARDEMLEETPAR